MEMEATNSPTPTTTLSDEEDPASRWTSMRTFYLFLDVTSMSIIVGSVIFLYWFRNKPIVAMGQPRMLAIMCFGSWLFAFSQMLGRKIQLNSDLLLGNFHVKAKTLCRVSVWCWIFSEYIVETILFLKLYRVYKVMQFRRNQTVLARHVLAPFLAGLTLPVVILGSYEKYRSNKKIHYCAEDTTMFYLWFPITLLLTVAVVIFAWRIRHVKESVGDTRRILRWEAFKLVDYSYWIAYYFPPLQDKLYSVLDGSVTAQGVFLIFSNILMFLYMVLPTIFLVFPRMYLVWYERVHGQLPDYVQVYGGNVHYCMRSGTFTRTDSEHASGRSSRANLEHTSGTSSRGNLELPQTDQQ